MLVLLVGCGRPETAERPSFDEEARRSPLVVDDDVAPTTSRPTMETTSMPADDPLPAEGDLVGVGGILGTEKFDGDGDRKVYVRRVGGELTTELVVAENVRDVWIEEVRVYGSAMPDRPAISPDGANIAFTSGISGLASVWLMPFEGGVDPIQLTNVGLHLLKRAPGQPPVGFVAPPIDDSLHFDGDDLVWNGPAGLGSVRWQ